MDPNRGKKNIGRIGTILGFVFCAAFALNGQEKTGIAIIPVSGSELANQDYWELINRFDAFLQQRYNFAHISTNVVEQYFRTYSFPLETDAQELKNIASDLKVETLLLPKIIVQNEKKTFKASLFNVKKGAISKTVLVPCDCQPEDIASFPFQKICALLFDAPEIILTGETKKIGLLPPPTVIELPTVPVVKDTTEVLAEPDLPEQPKRIRGRRSGAWKKYALGAVLLSGGVIYFVTQGGSDANGGEILTKLNDPPDPPDSGSR